MCNKLHNWHFEKADYKTYRRAGNVYSLFFLMYFIQFTAVENREEDLVLSPIDLKLFTLYFS